MENQNKQVYLLFPGDNPEAGPVAAFSSKEIIDKLANKLNSFIEGGVIVKEGALASNTLPIDKYLNLVEMDMSPFDISIHKDGYLFDKSDLLPLSFDEEKLEETYDWVMEMLEAEKANPKKVWGMGGVFWAPDRDLALQRALLQRRMVFTSLGIPLEQVAGSDN